ncbi:MAG: SGNH/GDSL hydrolase family protein, partial [Nanoarchaeota archaeon]|nr:SGNH/GDSL hydrolase family protein [Nanoarchaeota archaeon]
MKGIIKKILFFTSIIIIAVILTELMLLALEKIGVINYDDLIREVKDDSIIIYSESIGWTRKGLSNIKLMDESKAILVLGDSVAEGFCTNKTFSERLAEKDERLEVINMAVRGYNTYYEYKMLKNISYNPKVIILEFFFNDFRPANYIIKEKNSYYQVMNLKAYDSEPSEFFETMITKSIIYKQLYQLRKINNKCIDEENKKEFECIKKNQDKVREYLLKIKEIADEKNSDIII